MHRLNKLLLWGSFLMSMLPATNSAIYLVKLRKGRDRAISEKDLIDTYRIPRSPDKTAHQMLWEEIANILEPETEKSINKCIRLFGSIYGTKAQRLECLKKLRKQKALGNVVDNKPYMPTLNTNHYDVQDYETEPFIDETRNEISTHDSVTNEKHGNFLVNPEKLRNLLRNSNNDYKGPYDLPNYLNPSDIYDFRKSNKVSKRNMNVDSSDDESESSSESEESEEEETKKKHKYRKPKRFQVIDNIKKKKVAAKIKKPETDVSSEELSVTPSKHKKVSTDVSSDAAESSEETDLSEEVKPKRKERPTTTTTRRPKKSQKKRGGQKEYYLQGGRLIDPDEDDGEEYRRSRLEYFLPKRFNWDTEDIHSLGYYWFNGPQGRYPHYALRP